MDSVSQAVVGAILAQAAAPKKLIRPATLTGAVGGTLADLDIFIKSENDPLLNLEFHRHFTHSLIFIPLGGLIAALVCWIFLRKKLSFKALYLFATLGYATSGLLDACTTYGTHLFWPFSQAQTAWSLIAILDPVFTLTLLLLGSFACIKYKPNLSRIGLVFGLSYLALGFWQQQRVVDSLTELTQSRGHTPERISAHPTLGNLVLWRGIYEYEGECYIEAFNVGLVRRDIVHYPGPQVTLLDRQRDFPEIAPDSLLQKDITRFYEFSARWVSQPAGSPPFLLTDLRYSLFPDSAKALWGIWVDPLKPDEHAEFEKFRKLKEGDKSKFFKMIRGKAVEPSDESSE